MSAMSRGEAKESAEVLHVDMDAFYASVELARNPHLRGRPMWVGGGERGVVLSASYEARATGVASGMSATRARRLCPGAVVVPPDFDTYQAVSRGVVALFARITPLVEVASVDEAFLDVSGALRRLGTDPVGVAEMLRAQVADEQGITCSVGIGPNRFIAKMASRSAKPDGLRQVCPEQVIDFLHPLPVEQMWGVGEQTSAALRRLGLVTVGSLAHVPTETLQRAFGPARGRQLHDLAWGLDPRPIVPQEVERSIGCQETFARDTADPEVITTELLRLSARAAARMRRARMLGRRVSVQIRFADFTEISRQTSLPGPTDVTDEIHQAALRVWRRLNLQRARVRRVGVRVEQLVDLSQAFRQPALDEPARGMREVEFVADEAIRRFGPHAVRRASLTRVAGRHLDADQTDEVDGQPL